MSIMLPLFKGNFISSIPICIYFNFFSCLSALVSTSSMMSDETEGGRHPCLDPHREKLGGHL